MLDAAEIPFGQVIQALLDNDKPFPTKYIYRLSDITTDETASLEKAWNLVPLNRRQAVMEDVQSMGEDDMLMEFSAIGRLALHDSDAYVRLLGVRTLVEYELVDLLPVFLHMAENDADEQVRAASAAALGGFVYLGVIEEMSQKKLQKVEQVLLRIHQGTDAPLVRRRALEALGYSSRDEVPGMIERAFASGEREWLVSSLLAMGRSASAEWNAKVIAMLEDRRPDVRAEAVTAAGELGIRSTLHRLLGLLNDSNDEVRAAAIWALSEIGGEGVRSRLEALQEETEDDDEADLLESALENLTFNEEFQDFSILDLPEGEEEDESLLDASRLDDDFEEDNSLLDDDFEGDEEDDDDDQG